MTQADAFVMIIIIIVLALITLALFGCEPDADE